MPPTDPDPAPATIRRATSVDIAPITAFTEHTFSWGDYVAEGIAAWLEDPAMAVVVAVDEGDAPIGLARGQLLSATEAWFGSARVHPEHRGKRIADALAGALMEWARARGALVGRLLIEDDNEPSIRHVARIGMRRVASFSRCLLPVGNQTTPGTGSAAAAGRAEAEPAFASWSMGDLARAGHGLFATRWTFRTLTMADVEQAASGDRLWEVRGGWALGSVDDGDLEIGWLETGEAEAAATIRSLAGLAASLDATQLVLWLPDLAWVLAAARLAGCEEHPMGVYAIAL